MDEKSQPPVPSLDREHVLAFRLSGHDLTKRRPFTSLTEVVGACGLRNTPPGSASLGLHARMDGVQPDTLEQALNGDKPLVEVLAMRASPHIVPRDDVALFTLGALPQDEASLMTSLNAFAASLKRDGITATDALSQAVAAAHAELAGGPLSRGALSAGLTRRLPEALGPICRPCDSRHIHEMLFRLVGTAGGYVLTRHGKQSAYVRADQWLGEAPDDDPLALRSELLRRYLRCFGPSTANDFAAWVGIRASESAKTWDTMAERLVEVQAAGRRAWLHRDDAPALEAAPAPVGVRLLPPYDAYLDLRDRLILVPDKAQHRRIWGVIGNPGALLVAGEIAGVWRPQKKGKRLTITIEAFGQLAPATRDEIMAEAEMIGPLRGCTSVEVAYAD
jgi:hypothetical protein